MNAPAGSSFQALEISEKFDSGNTLKVSNYPHYFRFLVSTRQGSGFFRLDCPSLVSNRLRIFFWLVAALPNLGVGKWVLFLEPPGSRLGTRS